MEEKATFAAGCFWGVEETFSKQKGVLKTRVGYIGGRTDNPTYGDVCSGGTGHKEAVEVIFDTDQTSYEDLLDVFWDTHNPTTSNRQGFDIGEQYRSVVFYHSDEQKEKAEKSKEKLNDSGKYPQPVVTDIAPTSTFFEAEEYHQKYIQKRGGGVCSV